MADFGTAVKNVQEMAEIHFASDAELLKSAMYKLTSLETIFSRYSVQRTITDDLSAKVNAQVASVAASKLHPATCIIEVIRILKKGLEDAGVLTPKPAPLPTAVLAPSTLIVAPSPNSLIINHQLPTPTSNDESTTVQEVPVTRRQANRHKDDIPRAKRSRRSEKIDTGRPSTSKEAENSRSSCDVSGDKKESMEEDTSNSVPAPIVAAPISSDEATTSSAEKEHRPQRAVAVRNRNIKEAAAASKKEKEKEKKARRVSKRKVAKAESFLAKLSRKIKQLQGAEMSLDDLDSNYSAYMSCDKLEKKFFRVYKYLCELHGHSATTGRPIDHSVTYLESSYPQVNDEINKFLRKRKFPDYPDIRACVIRANTEHNLGIDGLTIDGIAKTAFMAIGRHMKTRRLRDFKENFGNHYTELAAAGEDPAFQNPELNEKLRRQNEIGQQRLAELIDEYARRQDEEVVDEPEEQKEGDDDKEDETSEDEEEEEDDEEEEEEEEEEEDVGELLNKSASPEDEIIQIPDEDSIDREVTPGSSSSPSNQ